MLRYTPFESIASQHVSLQSCCSGRVAPAVTRAAWLLERRARQVPELAGPSLRRCACLRSAPSLHFIRHLGRLCSRHLRHPRASCSPRAARPLVTRSRRRRSHPTRRPRRVTGPGSAGAGETRRAEPGVLPRAPFWPASATHYVRFATPGPSVAPAIVAGVSSRARFAASGSWPSASRPGAPRSRAASQWRENPDARAGPHAPRCGSFSGGVGAA